MKEAKQGTPLYHVVKTLIEIAITSGNYQPGDQLPTESQLCEQYTVSRTTIRLALQQLEFEGMIHRIQGKGTFISAPKIEDALNKHVRSFVEQMKDLGLQPHSKIISIGLIPATPHLSSVLNIIEKDPVFKLIRLRYADNKPLQYATSYVPWRLAPELLQDDLTGSLFELLSSKYQLTPYCAIESIEPIVIDDTCSRFFDVPEGSPAFLIESITSTEHKVPIEYAHLIVRGDRLKFVVKRTFS
ncbi:putative HTH-type transcriptional regulator YbgA [Paenibacillus baekrokdamisoli]|uniref:Putative HTH-type transcriptional regulator YbgA n=1 Tax=Paenibacillus baekrokdamisoli TaxID=1712516 RepID=A0A3G9JLD8_9BACL|nr:GntR family transcriptional regulator [Paenibacillus baekrokdamisoli]MBB3069439.1 GntR family transcriptional regulator [Paenibacillus baekrokdamisoli]BBH24988.1 putative HTH-type transcriptional regulator YbgA [Paenibacillus baekrokdamisoli]